MSAAAGVKTIGVLGAGQMGYGIAQVAAVAAKRDVVVVDRSDEQLKRGAKLMGSLLSKVSAEHEEILVFVLIMRKRDVVEECLV